MYYINTLKQELGTAKTYKHNLFDDKSAMIDIDAIWLLNLVYLLMRIIASFLRYTGYQNVIKDSIQHRIIANSSSCTTSELSIILSSFLIPIKNRVIKYCETVFERNGKNLFWSTLKQTYKRTRCIFYASSETKNLSYKILFP